VSGEAVLFILFILLCLFWFCVFNRRPRISAPTPSYSASRARYEMKQRLDDAQREREDRYREEKYEREDLWFREDMAHAHRMAEETLNSSREASRRSMEIADESLRMQMESLRRKGARV